jgi:hypothetical protein
MMFDVYNIEWAKKKTLKTGMTFKMPTLAAAIKSVNITSFNSYKCELVDPNGAVFYYSILTCLTNMVPPSSLPELFCV